MRKFSTPFILLAILSLCGCMGSSGALLDAGPNLPPDASQTTQTPQATLSQNSEIPQDPLANARPATKNNVVAMEYASAFSYGDLAKKIDATFRSCWIGKNPEFSDYAYGGLKQNGVQYIISLSENVNGQMMDLVKVSFIPASGTEGYAVSLETRAEGSPGEKTMKDGIRRVIGGGKVCG